MRAQFNEASMPQLSTMTEAFTETKNEQKSPEKRKRSWGWFLIVFFIVLLVGALGFVGKLYWDTQNRLTKLQEASASKSLDLTDAEVTALVAKVAKHVELPKEKPQVATVTNVDQLKIGQPFFRSALNGDKLLVFANRVVLYRPDQDKVIDIAQIRPPESGVAGISATSSANFAPKASSSSAKLK
jgi:uncharacterized membrane protein YvbJ